ncbi:MAG: hypothetical protein LBV67_10420, partial [Streptococcaceae bacterium]|nr:hypothetical protein [Streptococcaceae bacterium]
ELLEQDYEIPASQKLESEVNLMCNLSQGVEDKGIQIGIARGIEQGKINNTIDIAKNGIINGIDLNTISLMTGLSVDEIEKLKQIQ